LLVAVTFAATAPTLPVSGQSRGDPLPASIENPRFQNFDGSSPREATGFEEQQVAERLTDALISAANGLFSRKPGWECLRAAKLKRPWTVSINTTVWTAPAPNSAWSVASSVQVKPGPSIPSGRNRRTPPPGGSSVLVATAQLQEIIDELDSQGVKPCWPKAKVKGKRTVTDEGATIHYEWEGEQSLRLAQDGSLVFTKMDSTQVPSDAIVRCPDTPAPRSAPIRSWWGGSWLGEPEVRVPLEDGARVSLRPPWLTAEPGAGEMTLELEYGRSGGRPVAATSRD
jgi:hypothetical protein